MDGDRKSPFLVSGSIPHGGRRINSARLLSTDWKFAKIESCQAGYHRIRYGR